MINRKRWLALSGSVRTTSSAMCYRARRLSAAREIRAARRAGT